MNTKAIIKMSRCVKRERLNVGVNYDLIRAVCQTTDLEKSCMVTNSDIINFILYKHLIDFTDEDLMVKKIYSENIGNLKGAKSYDDSKRSYAAHDELINIFLP